MAYTTQELILAELQLLRGDFNSFARTTGERVSSLETDVHGLVGNGQRDAWPYWSELSNGSANGDSCWLAQRREAAASSRSWPG
jgi:hypothetical protein